MLSSGGDDKAKLGQSSAFGSQHGAGGPLGYYDTQPKPQTPNYQYGAPIPQQQQYYGSQGRGQPRGDMELSSQRGQYPSDGRGGQYQPYPSDGRGQQYPGDGRGQQFGGEQGRRGTPDNGQPGRVEDYDGRRDPNYNERAQQDDEERRRAAKEQESRQQQAAPPRRPEPIQYQPKYAPPPPQHDTTETSDSGAM